MIITKEIKNIFSHFDAGHPIEIYGGAGVGKTAVIQMLKERGAQHGKKVNIAAPTGMAANNVGGQTINLFFGQPAYLQSTQNLDKIKPTVQQQLINTDALVFEEASMINALQLDNLSTVAQHARLNRKPFGGLQIIVVGDPFQLPPVVNLADAKLILKVCFYSSVHFFASEVYQRIDFKTNILSKVFRQSNKKFIDVLNRVRHCNVTRHDVDYLNSRVQKTSNPHALTLASTYKTVDRVNYLEMDKISKPAFFYDATLLGNFKQENCPAPMQLILKCGARVMIVANIREEGEIVAYNGDIGTVIDLDDEQVIIELDRGKTVTIKEFTWEKYGYSINPDKTTWETRMTGLCKQMPLRIAYAITVHKAQGLSLDVAHIDLSSQFFSSGQLYVALSRAKTLEGLTLSRPLTITELKKFEHNINTIILNKWYSNVVQKSSLH